jgi:Ser/Thr protein kinase RdoA (MazF antagonist)
MATDFWQEPFFVDYGRLLGRIHRLSKSYTLPNPAWSRGAWQDPVNMNIHDDLMADKSVLGECYRELMAHLLALPQDADGYGMIHQDAHAGNFFVDENGKITLFDFDDCCTAILPMIWRWCSFTPSPIARTLRNLRPCSGNRSGAATAQKTS